MAGSINPALELQTRYANLINHTFDRLSRAVDDLGARKYSSDKFVSDALFSWMELTSAWFFPLEQTLNLIKDRNYVVPFAIKTTTNEATEIGDVPTQMAPDFESTDLGHLTHPKSTIAHDNVDVKLVAGGSVAVVHLFDLQKLKTPLEQGTYQGNIVLKGTNTAIAVIQVDVSV